MSAVSAGTVVLDDAGRPVSAFELDPTEVSVAEYARCVRAGACVLYTSAAEPRARLLERHHQSELCRGGRPDRADEPMNCVDWSSADAYCRWAGKRLPTREEWRHAVGRRHPDAAPELHRPAKEQSWYAAEWTASRCDPEPRPVATPLAGQ
jgi:formylglycine-generating enzyme required for sulfatase activity